MRSGSLRPFVPVALRWVSSRGFGVEPSVLPAQVALGHRMSGGVEHDAQGLALVGRTGGRRARAKRAWGRGWAGRP